jgi:23S rRNA pseudouridine2605 synthase/23S rRNA pseudouridine2604 synthase
MEAMRLQKFLSAAGFCSRRKGEEWIAQGVVSVNGKVVDVPGTKIDPVHDTVMVKGVHVTLKEESIYIALYKPVNYECTCRKKNEPIVTDLVDIPQRIYPVGRLDKDSEGLILLTNDGRIHHTLSHPSFEHEKEYVVGLKQKISDGDLQKMAGGMTLESFNTRPCRVKRLSDKLFSIVLKEGKNRQIRRMVEGVENQVASLKRVRISHIRIGGLKPGEWRHLTAKELTELMISLGFH